MKKLIIFLAFLAVIVLANWLYLKSQTSDQYLGIPAVPCQDYTKPVLQNFSLNIKISINGNPAPLAPSIGHDYGDCLRAIYTNDSSGTVYVKANTSQQYTLGDFFDVWRMIFNRTEVLNHNTSGGQHIEVTVDGQPVQTYENTVLKPNETINIVYQ